MAKEYDKIFKENFESLIENLVRKVLGINAHKLEEIPDYNHYTIERQPDFLKKILTGKNEKDYILQIEVQVDDSKQMIKRLFLYYGLLYNEYDLPVRQYVLYVGSKKKATMTRKLFHQDVTFSFHIINMQEVSYRKFIKSDTPEDVILAILGDFEGISPDEIIENILLRLRKLAKDELEIGKYVTQLEVLSKLRNLQKLTVKKIDNMGLIYDLQTDLRFLQGEATGVKKGEVIGIKKNQKVVILELIKEFPSLSAEKIAKMVHASKEFVLQVLEEYKRNNT